MSLLGLVINGRSLGDGKEVSIPGRERYEKAYLEVGEPFGNPRINGRGQGGEAQTADRSGTHLKGLGYWIKNLEILNHITLMVPCSLDVIRSVSLKGSYLPFEEGETRVSNSN